jgi:hypothetical protein
MYIVNNISSYNNKKYSSIIRGVRYSSKKNCSYSSRVRNSCSTSFSYLFLIEISTIRSIMWAHINSSNKLYKILTISSSTDSYYYDLVIKNILE